MPSLRKIAQEMGRGISIVRHGGPWAGWTFFREEVLLNTRTRFQILGVIPCRSKVECNICGWTGPRFLTHCGAAYIDRNCFCPRCHSYPRHRGFSWLVRNRLQVELLKLKGYEGTRLVFAPEPGLIGLLSEFVSHLEGADLHQVNKHVIRIEDLQNLSLADGSVDFVSCFHVLEHIPDDRKALSELNRVLHGKGQLVLCVPITFGRAETLDLGGPNKLLNDHCWDYGEDFEQRLLEASFSGVSYDLLGVVPQGLHARLAMVQERVFWLVPTPAGEKPEIRADQG